MAQNQEFFQQINQAFADGDVDFIMEHVADDVEWRIVGDSLIQGEEAVREMLEPMRGEAPGGYETRN